jgi:hypothetical protein
MEVLHCSSEKFCLVRALDAFQMAVFDYFLSEKASLAFDEFLDFIGERVQLKGFNKYRGGLDAKS